MDRRSLVAALGGIALVGAMTVAPAMAQSDRPRRIGFLGSERRLGKFEAGLADLGYAAGRDLEIVYRSGGRPEYLAIAAAELVAFKVEVIVAAGSPAIRAAQRATSTIPIVMTGASDPVGTGFVKSLAQPGGNITGHSLQNPELSGKRLALLKEVVPHVDRVGMLVDPDDPPVSFSIRETEEAAARLGIELSLGEARRADEFEAAFDAIEREKPDAVVILPASLMTRNAALIAKLTLARRLPSVSYFREFPEAGGLMSYGPNLDQLARQSAVYVDKILKGANPADLPVAQPTRFEFVVNLRTARKLDLALPTTVLAGADDVIE